MEEEKIIRQLAEHDVRIKTNAEDLKALDRKVDDLHKIATSVELIANDMGHIRTDINEMKEGNKELREDINKVNQEIIDVKNAPARKQSKFVDKIKDNLIWLVIGGIVSGILAMILPQFFK